MIRRVARWLQSRGSAASWAALFVLLAAVLVDFSTDTPHQPGSYLGPFYGLGPASQASSVLCAVALCVIALLPLFGARRQPGPACEPGSRAALLLRLSPLVALLFAAWWTRPHVPDRFGVLWNLALLVVPAALVVLAARRGSPRVITALAVLAGSGLRLVHFARFPIDGGADMLPLTQSALLAFLGGQSPYGLHHVPDPLPLTYLPLTWLAYLPAHLAGIDLRLTNLAAELACLAALVAMGSRPRPAYEGRPALGPTVGPALLLWSFAFLLPSSIYFDRITTAPVTWALLAWTVVAATRGARRDWVLAGLLAATTPLAAVVAPFLLVLWWRQGSLRAAGGRSLRAAAVALVIVLPFFLWSPRGFVEGVVLWFNDLDRFPAAKWLLYRTWRYYVGFGGLFWYAGLERWLAPIQGLLVLGLAVLAYLRGGRRVELAPHLAVAFVAFMVFNSVHWPYFFQPAIVCGLLAVVTLAAPPVSRGDSGGKKAPTCLPSS